MQRDGDTKDNDNKDLLRIGVGILNGFLGLLQAKIGIIRSLLINTVMDLKFKQCCSIKILSMMSRSFMKPSAAPSRQV